MGSRFMFQSFEELYVALLKALGFYGRNAVDKYMLLPELLDMSELQGPSHICLLPVTTIKGTCDFNYLK